MSVLKTQLERANTTNVELESILQQRTDELEETRLQLDEREDELLEALDQVQELSTLAHLDGFMRIDGFNEDGEEMKTLLLN